MRPHRVAKVKSFTEATPVYRVISAPPYAFAATAAGLDQWDLRSGRRIRPEKESRLFKAQISDLAYDADRRALWVVGGDGVARYDLKSDAVTRLELPDVGEATDALATAVLTPSPSGGIFLGVSTSVFHSTESGWDETSLGAPVSALHVDGDDIFVGTTDGLFALRDQTATRVDCDLASVREILPAPGSGVLAIGVADAGAERVAWIDGGVCRSFRPSPEVKWLDATSDGKRVVILTRSRVFELARRVEGSKVRRLSRVGMTLIPTAGPRDSSPFVLKPLRSSVPPGAQTVAVSGAELLVGTRSLGTARLAIDKVVGGDSRWLRREELAEGAVGLTVQCTSETECRLANGSGEMWRFDGERFVRRTPARPTLGLIDIGGTQVAVLAPDETQTVSLVSAPVTGELAEKVVVATLRVPDGFELRMLRKGVGRSALLGWKAVGAGLDAPFALVHSVPLDGRRSRTLGASGVPSRDVVACAGRLYVATGDGVLDITEQAERVADEPAHHLQCDRKQLVIATETAIVRRESGQWTQVLTLTQPLRDFAISGDGRIFIADDHGLGLWDGNRTRRYDTRRGLLENDIHEITLDRFGRIWIRGASSVGLFRL